MQSPVPGNVYVWGSADAKCFGGCEPDKEGVLPFPTLVRGLPDDMLQVECGDGFTVALSASGVVYSFGDGAKGKLGRSETPGRALGVVEGLADVRVTFIAVGQSHTLCIGVDAATTVPHLFGWGNTFRNSLGAVTDGSRATPIGGLPPDVSPVTCAAGYQNSAVVLEDGSVYVWGDNQHSKCGATGITTISVPTRLDLACPIKSVALGSITAGAVGCSGELFTWGYGKSGCLGHGDRKQRDTPTRVDALSNVVVTQLAFTKGQINPDTTGKVNGKEQPHAMCTTSTGALYSWGSAHKGMLGNHKHKILSPPDGDELVPYLVGGQPLRDDVAGGTSTYLAGERCTQPVASSIHSCVVTESGSIYSFGCGSGGRMGIKKYMEGLTGSRSRMKCYVSVPTAIEELQSRELHAWQASTSRHHMAAIVTSSSTKKSSRRASVRRHADDDTFGVVFAAAAEEPTGQQ